MSGKRHRCRNRRPFTFRDSTLLFCLIGIQPAALSTIVSPPPAIQTTDHRLHHPVSSPSHSPFAPLRHPSIYPAASPA